MTSRTRRQRRRSHGSKLEEEAADPARGPRSPRSPWPAASAASWAIDVYNSAPPLSSLQAGAEGPLLGDLRRRRQPDRLHPRQQHPPAGPLAGAAAEPQVRHGRDRGPQLLRARRDRPGRDRPRRLEEPAGRRQAGPGSLDDHPAARPQPLHPRPRTDDRAQADRSAPRLRGGGRALQEVDPHRLPQHRPLRHGRRGDRGRRRGGGADLLRQAGPRARPDRGGDDRRPAAGALRIQPLPRPARRAGAPQPGAGGDGGAGLHHAEPNTARRSTGASASTPATSTG